jgi:superfamily II DNA or RNA helicase
MTTGIGARTPIEGADRFAWATGGAAPIMVGMNGPQPLRLTFEGGTLALDGAPPDRLTALPGCRIDPRDNRVKAEAIDYRAVVEQLRRDKVAYEDGARAWRPIQWLLRGEREPRPYQTEALETWWNTGGRGLVVLPTGTGKTFLAVMAIAKVQRPALIVTPTIDLLNQWFDVLTLSFASPVGMLGGGSYDVQQLTVSTYDSAHIHLERWGDKFGLIVFDECHHLPGPTYQLIARGSLAPYRLGLTATPERLDGGEALFDRLIGPTVYRREIKELAGDWLADYDTVRLYVDLTPDEMEQYQAARGVYREFVARRGIAMSGPQGWQRFIYESSRTAEGRAAFLAYREQKRIAQAAPGKLNLLDELLGKHTGDRVLIFTADNATVYQIARRFLVPAITHQTKSKERRAILERFHSGEYPVLVSGQVLNEGVDVPAASVGVILSGTGSVREHVQRLGRLLRKHGEKQALLYEVVTRGTGEEYTSERRRQHHAYQ